MDSKEFLKHLHNPWLPIAMKVVKAEKGRPHDPITREEIAFAIENSKDAPPPVIRRLLAQIVKNEYRFKNGIKARPQAERQKAVGWFLSYRRAFEQHPNLEELRANQSKRGELSLRELALQVTAALYHVTPRTLENWIKENEGVVLEAHKQSGRHFDSARQALNYERDLEAAAKYRLALEGWPLPPLK